MKHRNNLRQESNTVSSIKQAIHIMGICIMNDIGVCLRIDLVFTELVSSLSLFPSLFITLRFCSKIQTCNPIHYVYAVQ